MLCGTEAGECIVTGRARFCQEPRHPAVYIAGIIKQYTAMHIQAMALTRMRWLVPCRSVSTATHLCIPDWKNKATGCTLGSRVSTEGVLRLGHADGQMPKPHLCECCKLLLCDGLEFHAGCAIYLLCDDLNLFLRQHACWLSRCWNAKDHQAPHILQMRRRAMRAPAPVTQLTHEDRL